MQHIITEFNYETGNIKIITPVPFTMDDLGINYRSVSRPKYEDKRSYNIFDLIRKNEELEKENQKYKVIVDILEFIKARAIAGATQETINKLAINFVNSYIKESE